MGMFYESEKIVLITWPLIKSQLGLLTGAINGGLTAVWEMSAGLRLMAVRAATLAAAGWSTLVTSIQMMAAATWEAVVAGAAFAVTPVGLTIIGIAAASAAVWYYWENITYAFSFYGKMVNSAATAAETIFIRWWRGLKIHLI